MSFAFPVKMPRFCLDQNWRGDDSFIFLIYAPGRKKVMNNVFSKNGFLVDMARGTEKWEDSR